MAIAIGTLCENNMPVSLIFTILVHSAGQGIPSFLMNLGVYYHIHKGLQLVPILSQSNPSRSLHPISLRSILILSFHP
jgi:hypothetical protein